MPALKPAYLVHGDDHGALAERRRGLRVRAEGEGASVEVLTGEDASPAGVARALAAMTLALERRVIIVEGAEGWRAADVEAELAPALAALPDDTTIAFFAREEGRAKAPAPLAAAVKKAGGQIMPQLAVKPWELPGWVREQAKRLGLELDSEASHALIRQVGERQQRLLRELEKLALEADDGDSARTLDVEAIEARAAHSAERRAYELADALVARDAARATACYLAVREQGESLSGLMYLMARRVRDALAVAVRLQAGEPAAQIKRDLRMPSRAASRFVKDIEGSDPEHLRAALRVLADLELDSRGGALLDHRRSPSAALSEDSLALRAIGEIAA